MGLAVRFIPRKEALLELQKTFPDFKPHYIEAIQAMFQLSAELEKAIDQYFIAKKFSRARYLILMILMHCQDKKMSPHDIAEKLNVTRGNMTGLIDGLMKDGYVTKVQCEEDRRQVWIEVTPKARQFLNKIMPDYFKRMSKFMSVMKKEEIELMTELSRKMLTGVQAFNE